MSEDVELDYDYLTSKALKGVLSDVLLLTQELGAAPGEHHFYIEFLTKAEGVDIPDYLMEDYPERMTIVLQHQFKDLGVREDGFSVTLWFKGQPAALTIPFDAVVSFADPSVQFGLRFEQSADEARELPASKSAEDSAAEKPEEPEKETADAGADVVSLDAFRKK